MAFIVTAVVFVVYQEIENHILNPIIMSRTVRINPLLVLVSVLIGAKSGWPARWLLRRLRGGPAGHTRSRAAIQVIVREVWKATDPEAPATTSRHRSKAAGTAVLPPGRRPTSDTGVITRTPMPGAQMNAPVP